MAKRKPTKASLQKALKEHMQEVQDIFYQTIVHKLNFNHHETKVHDLCTKLHNDYGLRAWQDVLDSFLVKPKRKPK